MRGRACRMASLLIAGLAAPARAQPAPDPQTCVDVRIGEDRSYACINEELARVAQRAHGAVPSATLSATAPPQAIGAFDRSATAERMGNRFGHSAFAQRPPPLIYPSPLLGPATRH